MRENMLVYMSLDIISSSKLTVFFELRSRKTARILEWTMSADNYPCIFSRQIEDIVYSNMSQGCFIKYSFASVLFFILRIQI